MHKCILNTDHVLFLIFSSYFHNTGFGFSSPFTHHLSLEMREDFFPLWKQPITTCSSIRIRLFQCNPANTSFQKNWNRILRPAINEWRPKNEERRIHQKQTFRIIFSFFFGQLYSTISMVYINQKVRTNNKSSSWGSSDTSYYNCYKKMIIMIQATVLEPLWIVRGLVI